MIRALLKKQLLELGAAFVRSSKTGKRRSRAGAFGYALLFAVLMLLVMLSFGSMALPLAVTLVPQGLDWLYFVLMELSALTVSVLASAFTSYGHLFRCRDNQQLLALPIPPGAIFAVRCGGVYLTGLIYLLLAWVPSVVCYALAAPRPGGALLAALPVALALAGVSMVLAVLLGWAVALLNRRAQHKSLVTVVGTLLFLAVYYAAFCWVSNAVEALAVDAVQAGATAGRVAAPLHLLGLAAVGNVPALLQLLLTLPGAWFCAGCAMAVLCIPAGQGLLVLAVLAAFVWLTAQLGLALGLCLPNLHWVSEAAVVKRSAASMLAMFGGWLLAGGVLFLPLTLLDYAVPPLAAQGACLAALLGLDLLLHRWLCTRGAARFAALH